MSFPVFKDFDKNASDLLNDDFDSKYSLKIKTAGPFGVTFTTNTTFDEKTKAPEAKVSAKYAHSSGFTVEKLEVSPKGNVSTETSLVNVAPGLKLEFKGNDSDKGDLSVTYSVPKVATLTAELDALNFSKANATVTAGNGPFVAGASLDLKIAKNAVESSSYGLGLGYTAPQLFAGVRVTNNLSQFSGLFSYNVSNDLTLLGKVTHTTGGKSAGTAGVVAGVYQYGPKTTLKVKTSSAGVVNASVKRQYENKFAVVTSAEVTTGPATGYKVGVNATLG